MGMSKTINLRKEKLSSDIESISLYSTLLGEMADSISANVSCHLLIV